MYKLLTLILAAVSVLTYNGVAINSGISVRSETVYRSIELAPFAGEISEVRSIVNDFLELREIHDRALLKTEADRLDERINNLGLVKKYCNNKISSYELLTEKDQYKKLQQICPALETIPLSKAIKIWSTID